MNSRIIIRIAIIILLLLCLFNWPYGYYQFVRFATMAGFSYLAYHHFKDFNKIDGRFMIYIFIVLLFQPLYKISLGRLFWNVVDVFVAVFLTYEIINLKYPFKQNS